MMPKSTKVNLPSASTNRFPGCMSAWKKPSRSAWRRKVWITACDRCLRSKPLASSVARSYSGVPSIHSSVSTSLAVRSQSTAGTRKSGSALVFSAISDSAAASSRRSISSATERRKVSTVSISRSRRASADRLSACCAAKVKASRSTRKRRSTFGRSTFTATGLLPSGVATSARCTCAIEAAATAGPNDAKASFSGLPSGCDHHRLGLGLRERRHLVLQRFQIARERHADDVGPRRQELAELDVGRPELGQRGREPALRADAGRPLEQARELERGLRRQRQRRRIDQREHALAREHEAGAGKTGEMGDRGDHGESLEPPAGVQRHHAAGHRLERDAAEAGLAHHLGEASGRGNLRIDSTR